VAAKAFVQEVPSDVRIGIVTFAGTATVVQPPTRSQDDLVAAIDRFQLQLHTAIGSGPSVSRSTLFADEDISIEQVLFGGASGRERRPLPSGRGGRDDAKDGKDTRTPKKPFTPVAAGSYPSGAIILLADGDGRQAPIHRGRQDGGRAWRPRPVGFSARRRDGRHEGMSISMRFDEAVLKSIAEITRRGSMPVPPRPEDLPGSERQVVLEKKATEIHDAVHRTRGAACARVGGQLWSRIP
jgi:Ca-activated chloride channel family protein